MANSFKDHSCHSCFKPTDIPSFISQLFGTKHGPMAKRDSPRGFFRCRIIWPFREPCNGCQPFGRWCQHCFIWRWPTWTCPHSIRTGDLWRDRQSEHPECAGWGWPGTPLGAGHFQGHLQWGTSVLPSWDSNTGASHPCEQVGWRFGRKFGRTTIWEKTEVQSIHPWTLRQGHLIQPRPQRSRTGCYQMGKSFGKIIHNIHMLPRGETSGAWLAPSRHGREFQEDPRVVWIPQLQHSPKEDQQSLEVLQMAPKVLLSEKSSAVHPQRHSWIHLGVAPGRGNV